MLKRSLPFLMGALVATTAAACKKDEATPANTTAEPQTGQPSGQVAQPQQPQHPASQPANQAAQGAATVGFTGKVTLGEGIAADNVAGTDVLFVMARLSNAGQPGPLVASVRFAPPTMPQDFAVTSKDTMLQGTPFTGPFIVNARLDRDGNPMTKTADDLYGSFAGEVTLGQQGVNIVLTKGMPPQTQPVAPPAH